MGLWLGSAARWDLARVIPGNCGGAWNPARAMPQGCFVLSESIVRNVPASIASAYPGGDLIVRSRDPVELAECLAANDPRRIAYVQLLTVDSWPWPLVESCRGIPVDLVVRHPENDLPLLYRWTPLLDDRPVRISVPVVAGFGNVVTLAAALNFAVKLEVRQPDPPLVEEMHRVLQAYLHQTTVAQPIEYFHSLLLALYRREPASLWAIQEEDPALCRHITDDGREVLPGRFGVDAALGDAASFLPGFREELLGGGSECSCCEHMEYCIGYFRLPERGYDCEGVKSVFQVLKAAAEELRSDYDSYGAGSREKR